MAGLDEQGKRRRGPFLYGRRATHALTASEQELLDHHGPALRLDLSRPPPANLRDLFRNDTESAGDVERVALEIGFGSGEHLLHRLHEDERTGRIGVEPFVNGMARLVSRWSENPVPRLRLYDDDASLLFDWLPDASLDHLDVLYPDPWRKGRHHKRRIVGPKTLGPIARVLRPGATFHFASDWPDYVNWTLYHVRAHAAFEWRATSRGDWDIPFEGWPGTRYEAKALREGRTPAYLRFRRN